MKLLICDDDITTVDVIQSQLDCSELGITRILRAYNGLTAKEIIARERPELILCDIGMPKCNGLEVLKYVYENGIETEFCFLTCYEDFEYAQTALRYGASNYMTKPFDFEELKIALQRMVAAVKRKRTAGLNASPDQYDAVLNSFLRQLSDGMLGGDRDRVAAALERNGLRLTADSRWRMVFSCADMTDAVKDVWTRELLLYTYGRAHDEALAHYIGSAYTLISADDRFMWCTCFVPAEGSTEDALRARCDNLMTLCADHMSLRPAILISEEFPLWRAAEEQRRLFSGMRRMRFYAGRVLPFRELDTLSERETAPLPDGTQIYRYLKKRDAEGFRDYIRSVVRAAAAAGTCSREVLNHLRRELINIFLSCLRDNDLPTAPLFADGALSALDAKAANSFEDLENFALALFDATGALLQRAADADDIIARVTAYIQANFRENIDRDDVAAVAYITPNYLSKQFRSKMGMNLREYINQIRVEEAKRLLLSTNLPVSEVAGLAGYENISYFSTVFRKRTGMSPVDWRNSGGGGGAE